MLFLLMFMLCTLLSLTNLPFVLQEGGSVVNLIAMIFLAALALFHLIMAVKKTISSLD